MSQLTVNLDMVAALRELGATGQPDPAQAAVIAELNGADGISISMRRDRRFVRDRDLYLLKGVTKTKLIVEMPPSEETIERAAEVKPWMVVFVADHADSSSPVTTIDFDSAEVDFSEVSARLTGIGVQVGYFVDPRADQVKGAARAGANALLFDCSGYTQARTLDEAQQQLDAVDSAVQAATKQNLGVYCGRGVTYQNARPLVELGLVDEFIIGRALASRAMLMGMESAVREMKHLLTAAQPQQ